MTKKEMEKNVNEVAKRIKEVLAALPAKLRVGAGIYLALQSILRGADFNAIMARGMAAELDSELVARIRKDGIQGDENGEN